MDIKFKDNSKLKFAPFTQLEYIESTGTQYIQTNFSLNLSNKVFCKIKENVHNSNEGVPFAATLENNKMFYLQYGNNIKFCYFNNAYTMQSIDTNVHEFTLNDNGKYYIDGVEKGTVTQQNINLQNFRIFDIYVPNSSTNFKFTGRIYFIEIYDGATLLHNFIPVKDNNNVVCMYDTVSETFFYNQGTGDFIAGPPVKSVLPENILLKTTTLYHKNTPYVNGLQLLKGILNTQEIAEDVVLNRVRVDIGNVSGSLGELLQYAGMAGFNDNYEQQTKPRLVGTWTINDWYTTSQLAQAQAAFDGLTIVGDPNYVLDFSQMAVQVLDPNEDNYNPAVAIILQGQNLGTTMTDAPLGHGRWFLTKTEAASITIGRMFINVQTVSDTNLIVDSVSASYLFEYFDEYEYFGDTLTAAYDYRISCPISFQGCTNLKHIKLPSTITYIATDSWGQGFFYECYNLTSIDLSNVTTLKGDAFMSCSSLTSVTLSSNLTTFGGFRNCFNLKITSIPQTVTTISDFALLNTGRDLTYDSSNALDINLPNLTYIGIGSFQEYKHLKTITSLGSITETTQGSSAWYRNGTFRGCVNLTTVNLPSTITKLTTYTFAECSSLTTVNLPSSNSLTKLDDYCFYQCRQLVTFNISGILEFYTGCLCGCASLTCTSLNSNIICIYPRSFYGCNSVSFTEISASITGLGSSETGNTFGTFSQTTSIPYLHFLSETPITGIICDYARTSSYNSFYGTTYKIYVGDGTSESHDNAILAAYQQASNWSGMTSYLDTWYNFITQV